MRAVIWTDVFQFLVFSGGLLAVLVKVSVLVQLLGLIITKRCHETGRQLCCSMAWILEGGKGVSLPSPQVTSWLDKPERWHINISIIPCHCHRAM